MILKAKHVIPVAGAGGLSRRAVIDNGLVEIHETRIVDVRPSKPHERGSSIIDCGDAVLLPGFVNAHTHLELSHLQGKVTPVVPVAAEVGDSVFTGWLRRLLAEMRSAPDEESGLAAAANEGAAFSLRAGVTTVGDITRRPDITRPVLRAGRLRVVSFGEVIALGALREKLRPRLDAALDRTHDSDRLNAAVSPHAPYTCDRRALRACKEAASAEKARLCMHLAESPEETLCTEHGRGPLVDLLRSVGVWNDSVKTPGLAPVEYADLLGLLSPRTLLAHVNYLSDADLDRLARSGVHVAYCPRTHAAFGHAPHRFGEMLSAGINVCIGTDSLASTPSLSVLDELRQVRRTIEQADTHELIEMGTLRGARALGLDRVVGSLEPGKQADMVVVPLARGADCDPGENLLRSTLPPTRVYIAGKPIPPIGSAESAGT